METIYIKTVIKHTDIYRILAAIIFTMAPLFLDAQSFEVSKIETHDYPLLRTTFSARDAKNRDYLSITPDDFEIVDNGDTIESKYISVNCDDNIPVQIVFLLDFSASIKDSYLSSWIQQGITEFLDLYPLQNGSVAAIVGFSDTATVTLNFTSDIDKLKYYSSHFVSKGLTNYNIAFDKAISLLITNPAQYPKYIIMMSDGKHYVPGTDLDSKGIVEGLDSNGIVLFGIQMKYLGSDLPYLAHSSGGYSYYAHDDWALQEIMNDITTKLKGDIRCRLSWQTIKKICIDTSKKHDVSITFLRNYISVSKNYFVPDFNYIPSVKFKSSKCFLGTFFAQTQNTCFIEKALINYGEFPVILKNLTLTGEMNTDFSLVGNYENITIPAGDSLNITIRFIPDGYGERTCAMNTVIECADTKIMTLVGISVCDADAVENNYFGTVQIDNNKTDTIVCAIQNLTAEDLTFTPRLAGIAARDFSFKIIGLPDSSSENIILKGNSCFDFEVKFNPSQEGLRQAYIQYYIINGCNTNNTELTGNGSLPDLTITSHDWGRQRINGKYGGVITIQNKTPIEHVLTDLKFINEDHAGFGIVISDLPINIPAQSSLDLDVEFFPTQEINYSTQIKALIEKRTSPLIADLKGAGFLPKLVISTECGNPVKFGDYSYAKLILRNPGTSSPVKIDHISLYDSDNEYFWKNGQPISGILLDTNGSISFDLLFKPNKSGSHKCNLDIYADNYDGVFTDEWKINTGELNCNFLDIEYTNPLSFGPAMPCSDLVSNITIKNLSSVDTLILYLSKASFEKNDGGFLLTSNDDTQIPPSNDIFVPIIYNPQKPGKIEDILNIPNSFEIPVKVSLSGESTEIAPYTENKSYSVNIGEEFTIPVYAKLSETNPNYISNISLTLKFNPKTIFTKSATFREILTAELSGDEFWNWDKPIFNSGSIFLKGSGKLYTPFDKELFTINFLALLTESPSTNVLANLNYGCYESENKISEININPICIQNSRYIEISSTQFGIISIAPSPTNSILTIDFGVGFDSQTSLEIFNALGNQEYDLMNVMLKTGQYSIDLDCSRLLSGVYFLLFNSGSYKQSRQFVIEK